MVTGSSPQRAWRSACPNCGAPVEFASAASPMAVCSFCRSTLVRDGEALRRIGQQAELFDDHSPLQLGVTGRWQGVPFSVVGRLQLRYDGGSWNEWHVLYDGGRSGWLSEDNGRYVLAFDAPLPAEGPRLETLRVGEPAIVDGRRWEVGSITVASVGAAEGELPIPPGSPDSFTVVDLRNAGDEVGTLDYADPQRPRWSVGRSAPLADLSLAGLRESSEKTLGSRSLACPNCGTALEIRLDSTQSIACHQCKAVIDVSQGLGGELRHYVQGASEMPAGGPRLALGATATLALGGEAQAWQLVGYVERCEVPDDPHDERVFWREYLLYARSTGFVFLVDAEDGWSWTAPITGAPELRGEIARWRGRDHRKLYSYRGEITQVLGEFYWRLQRGETTFNTDYAGGRHRLNREQAGDEVTWSAGETIDAASVARAFGLPAGRLSMPAEASPLSGGGAPITHRIAVAIFVVALVVTALQMCSADACDDLRASFGPESAEYQQCRREHRATVVPRTGGGSFGGLGSGGGHK